MHHLKTTNAPGKETNSSPHIKEKFSLSECDRLHLPSRHLQGLDQDSEYYSKRFLEGFLFLNLPILLPFPILPQSARLQEEEPWGTSRQRTSVGSKTGQRPAGHQP